VALETDSLTCPSCGASLSIPQDADEIICDHCGTSLKIEWSDYEDEEPKTAETDVKSWSTSRCVLAALYFCVIGLLLYEFTLIGIRVIENISIGAANYLRILAVLLCVLLSVILTQFTFALDRAHVWLYHFIGNIQKRGAKQGLKMVGIWIGSLLALFLIVGGIGALAGARSSDQSMPPIEAAQAVLATEIPTTSLATEVVSNSPTALPATATPVPTVTPRPTETLPVSTGTPKPQVSPTPYSARVTANSANIRQGPGTNYAIVASAKQDEVLMVVDSEVERQWVHVTTSNGTQGYMSATLLVKGSPTPLEATPTSQGADSVTADDQAYAQDILDMLTEYQDSLTNISVLMGKGGQDPTLILDADWKHQVALNLAIWKLEWQEIQLLEPPARFIKVHQEVLIFGQHFDRAADLTAAGIDQFDQTKLRQAAAEIDLGNASVQRCNTEMRAVLASLKK
jgi:uncharacterized protein YgiM (DUF1202 family)